MKNLAVPSYANIFLWAAPATIIPAFFRVYAPFEAWAAAFLFFGYFHGVQLLVESLILKKLMESAFNFALSIALFWVAVSCLITSIGLRYHPDFGDLKKAFLPGQAPFWNAVFIFTAAFVVFKISMVVNCLRSKRSRAFKAAWVAVLVLMPAGAVIYFIREGSLDRSSAC